MAKRDHGEGTAIRFNERLNRYEQRIGFMINGKHKIKAFYGKSKKEVQEKAKKWRQAREMGMELDAEKITYGQWLARWMEVYKKPSVEVTTYQTYETLIRIHIVPEIGCIKLLDIKRIELQALLNKLFAGGLAVGTIE